MRFSDPRRLLRLPLLPWLALALAMMYAGFGWQLAGNARDAEDELAFVRRAERGAADIEREVARYAELAAVLRRTVLTQGTTDPEAEVARHLVGLDLKRDYPAVLSARFVPLSGASPWANGGDAIEGAFRAAPGDEPGTGRVRAGAPIVLPIAAGEHPAFLIHAPLVGERGSDASVSDGRRPVGGEIAVLVDAAVLVRTAFPATTSREFGVIVEDGGATGGDDRGAAPKRRVFASTPAIVPEGAPGFGVSRLMHRVRLDAAGRAWELRLSTGTVPGVLRPGALLVLLLGVAGSVLVFFVLRSIDVLRASAERRAGAASRRQAERESEYRTLLDNVQEVVVRLDMDAVVSFVNPAWSRLTGIARADTLGRPLMQFIATEDRARATEEMRRLAHGERDEIAFTARFTGERQSVRWLQVRHRVLRDAEGLAVGITGTLVDVTERVEAEQRVHHLAHHDTLTGLPNRMLLEDRFGMALRIAKREDTHLGLLYIDLDHFKAVNDGLGHEVGDTLLRMVAGRLANSVRGTDTVARIGGDEFVVLLPGAHHPDVTRRIAATILEALSEEMEIGPHRVRVTPSIGIAAYPHDGDSLATLLASADAAMYRAKQSGRNRAEVHSPVLGVATTAGERTGGDAAGPIGENEIALRFRPQRDLHSGALVGAELRLHWNDRRGDAVTPSHFLPVTEAAGLIVPLGHWAMHAAFGECNEWRMHGGASVRLCVPVSMRELQQPNFLPGVERAIARSGIEPSSVWFAVEARVATRPAVAVAATLRGIAALGCVLGLRDTEDSPLEPRAVKGDPAFRYVVVGRDRWSTAGRRGAEALLDAAERRGWLLIADDVRTQTELDRLARMGFDVAQGDAVGRVMGANGMLDALSAVPAREQAREAASAA